MTQTIISSELVELIGLLEAQLDQPWFQLAKIIKQHPQKDGGFFSKTEIIQAYRQLNPDKNDEPLVEKLKLKPTRSASGVAPVTVLTKPFPCPGHCIFCPNDLRMPKSYLADEPGAQRAEKNYFDPYLQVTSRLRALSDMGHQTDKVELIILGGTWTAYPEPYRFWFIKQCFQAMNDFDKRDQSAAIRQQYELALAKLEQPYMSSEALDNARIQDDLHLAMSDLSENYNQLISEHYLQPEKAAGISQWQGATWTELGAAQKENEQTGARCVGLVLETRPDEINEQSVIDLRHLGATKIQLGVQSLDDEVLAKNRRGHDRAQTERAIALLRQAGFKIHVHWMANLYGSDVAKDQADFARLFSEEAFRPDELKIYPCSLLETAPLMKFFKQGLWRPYSYKELLTVTTFTLQATPAYCRITRMIRDIPAQDIVSGNTKSNFRQIAEDKVRESGGQIQEIRAREIRRQKFDPKEIHLSSLPYSTTVSEEYFLQFTVPVDSGEEKLLGFLRLSLPKESSNFISELVGCAMIREIHVYGQALAIGDDQGQQAQHLGLGKRLIAEAAKIAAKQGFKLLAVISAIGTREYYRARGFRDGQLYQFLDLEN